MVMIICTHNYCFVFMRPLSLHLFFYHLFFSKPFSFPGRMIFKLLSSKTVCVCGGAGGPPKSSKRELGGGSRKHSTLPITVVFTSGLACSLHLGRKE